MSCTRAAAFGDAAQAASAGALDPAVPTRIFLSCPAQRWRRALLSGRDTRRALARARCDCTAHHLQRSAASDRAAIRRWLVPDLLDLALGAHVARSFDPTAHPAAAPLLKPAADESALVTASSCACLRRRRCGARGEWLGASSLRRHRHGPVRGLGRKPIGDEMPRSNGGRASRAAQECITGADSQRDAA